VIDDAPEREAVSRLFYPVRAELGVQETDDGKQLHFPKGMPHEAEHRITVVHRFLFDLQLDSITVRRSVSLQKIPGMFSGTSVGRCTMRMPGPF
jgi:hypothetical protein